MESQNKNNSTTNSSILDILIKERQDIKKEIEKLKVRVEVIDDMITKYSGNTYVAYADESVKVTITNRDNLILNLFNSIGRCMRLPDVERHYRTQHEDSKPITNICRRLRNEGHLVVVKYNSNNKLSFWGLPTWLEDSNFKSEYGPDRNELPAGTIKAQVI